MNVFLSKKVNKISSGSTFGSFTMVAKSFIFVTISIFFWWQYTNTDLIFIDFWTQVNLDLPNFVWSAEFRSCIIAGKKSHNIEHWTSDSSMKSQPQQSKSLPRFSIERNNIYIYYDKWTVSIISAFHSFADTLSAWCRQLSLKEKSEKAPVGIHICIICQ